MRNLRFWARNWLISVSCAGAAALLLVLLVGLKYSDVRDVGGMLSMELSLFPYYLFVGGIFILMVVTINYFQIYFSVLLSMNCTRKSIACGIVLTDLAVIAAIGGISAAIWAIVPGDIARSALPLLPLLTGCLLIECAVLMVIGITVLRWGKAGMIILIILCMITGGFFGALVALNSNTFIYLQELSLELNFYPALWVGLGLYILAAVFVAGATRNAEVRV